VGLEHIEPENLHIRSWGLVADGTTFTSTFKSGQVLFGKRRAYQRKVAVADFDGVCSSDIYVFESKDPNVLLPELVPFICQSEGFYDYAVKTSAGSLSPRTNWSHLANYEFPLPPVDEQRRIADLLWAADDVIVCYNDLLSLTSKTYQAMVDEYYFKGISSANTNIKVSDAAQVNKAVLSSKTEQDYEILYIDIATILSPGELGTPTKYSFSTAPSRARRIVTHKDILISMVRPYQRSFAQVNNPPNNLVASTGIAVVTPDSQINPDYLYHLFFTKAFKDYCDKKMTGTNYPAIKPSDVSEFTFPLLPRERQDEIAVALNQITETKNETHAHLVKCKELKQSLMKELIGG
jgi:type I restriction enzyme S subunit